MRIRVKLMGLLKVRTPEGGTLALGDGATIEDALRALEIAPRTTAVITVNGRIARDRTAALVANDELIVIPPVGGG